jgi:hypothetical protein
MTIGLGKRELDAIFVDSPLEVGMPSGEGGGHINFEVCGDSDIVTETT